MRTPYSPPYIPDSLGVHYDDQAQVAHERLAAHSLEDLISEIPEIKAGEVAGKRLLYVDMPAVSESDSDEALVLSLPHANGWKPHMYLRARYLQEGVAPNYRLIVLPNNSLRERAYELSDQELAEVEAGDLGPIAERQKRLILQLGIGRVGLMGYSLGAMDAAVLARVIKDDAELLAVGIFEAPNVVERTGKDLKQAFMKSGLGNLSKAVTDAGIPALSDAMKRSKLYWDILKFGLATEPWSPWANQENKALVNAMATNGLSSDLAPAIQAQPNSPVLLAAAEKSLISPPVQVEYHFEKLGETDAANNVNRLYVEGYGHEMGDNIVAHAMLGKAALQK